MGDVQSNLFVTLAHLGLFRGMGGTPLSDALLYPIGSGGGTATPWIVPAFSVSRRADDSVGAGLRACVW